MGVSLLIDLDSCPARYWTLAELGSCRHTVAMSLGLRLRIAKLNRETVLMGPLFLPARNTLRVRIPREIEEMIETVRRPGTAITGFYRSKLNCETHRPSKLAYHGTTGEIRPIMLNKQERL